jgi:hypothetical protein
MPQSAFIVRPFGRKPFAYPTKMAEQVQQLLDEQEAARKNHAGAYRALLVRDSAAEAGNEVLVDFDAIEEVLIKPALAAARIRGETTGAVVEAGNIREDMFNRLITADLVIADVSLHNPNVFYELGLRQAFRDKFTFVIRCDLNPYPFDLQTDRYFDYRLSDLLQHPHAVVAKLTTALRKTLNQYRADSPVFKLMPQLEAEDRSRFLSVPEDFREEVDRARRQRQSETLDLLALECEDHLWEIEGLRVVGRAQFEANFIDGAKDTWQRIAARYPDDAEANTVLSTVYQRLSDRTRSEQALARVTRSRTLSPSRLSELRGLNGRNLKAAWIDYWRKEKNKRLAALRSPLLQRAIDAYLDAFKLDLNNSYAGLNALTLLVMQAELIDGQREEWRELQRYAGDEQREFEQRAQRIDQLAQSLLLALESDRDRLGNHGQGDPWFVMLEAAVMCTISSQPNYVAQLYVEARYYAPPKSDASMMAALQMYKDLDIRGVFKNWRKPQFVGTLGDNVEAALQALRTDERTSDTSSQPKRLLVFVGLRVDEGRRAAAAQAAGGAHGAAGAMAAAGAGAGAAGSGGSDGAAAGDGASLFPPSVVEEARRLIEAEVDKELAEDKNLLAMAGGASGGDLLFHEICRARKIPAQMFLALPKPQHIGEYVAPAGSEWVSRFIDIHRELAPPEGKPPHPLCGVKVFSDSADLPRWLQDRDLYNVGRRSMLWMLQHAHNLAHGLDSGVEITLIALRPRGSHDGPGAFGGIKHAIRLAQMHGVNVREIDLPVGPAAPAAQAFAGSDGRAAADVPPHAASPRGKGIARELMEADAQVDAAARAAGPNGPLAPAGARAPAATLPARR